MFNALFQVLGTYDEKARTQAARARVLYPAWAWPHAIVAGIQRVSGNLDPAVLDDLMRTLPSTRHEKVFHEAYVHALQLTRWGDAERVVEALEQLVGHDPQVGDRADRRAFAAQPTQNSVKQTHVTLLRRWFKARPSLSRHQDTVVAAAQSRAPAHLHHADKAR